VLISVLAIIAAFGCQSSSTSSLDKAKTAPSGINLAIGDAKSLAELIAKHKGQVVFVDYWATWCGPCVEGFPHTVDLSKKYRDQGMATIAVSFDQLADQKKVEDFLTERGASFEHLLSKYNGASQQAAVDFDIEPLPEYRLYDREGKLRGKWQGQSDEIENKIQELLKEEQ